MTAYRVTRAWFGVRVGDVVETDSLHPALASHVEPMPKQERGRLEVATPDAPSDVVARKTKPRKKG